MRPRLVIFVKAPLIGKAKTRLAADIGRVEAWREYRAMTARILRQVQSPKWDTVLAVTPAKWIDRMPLWDGLEQYAQVNGSLSPRLAQAFSGKGKTVVIGSDSPQVTGRDIDLAFKTILPDNFVFGPADDGGFWLMGAQGQLKRTVFDNVRWSTETTLSDLRKNLDGEIRLLRLLTDVDNLEALRLWRRELGQFGSQG